MVKYISEEKTIKEKSGEDLENIVESAVEDRGEASC